MRPRAVLALLTAAALLGVPGGGVQPHPAAAQADVVEPFDRPILAGEVLTYPVGQTRPATEPRLVVVEPDGSRRRLVPGAAAYGRYEPDGGTVAVAPSAGGVEVVAADGSGPRVVGEGSLVDQPWSPDRRSLLVVGPEGELQAVDVPTGEARVLESADDRAVSDAVWAPDGASVAVMFTDRVHVVPLDGGDVIVIEGLGGAPAWSPDSARLALGRPDPESAAVTLVVVGADGEGVRDLPVDTGGRQVRWAPDGQRIAASSPQGVAIVDLESGEVREVPIGAARPDGDRVHVLEWAGTQGPLVQDADQLLEVRDDAVVVRAAGLPPSIVPWSLPAVAPPAQSPTVARALHRSRELPDGSAATVLLARDDDFGDSLASGGAQGAWDAPLLLTPRTVLDPAVATELARLGAREVVVLGGPAALDPAVEDALRASGLDVTRIGGDTRLSTATALADAIAARTGRTPTTAVVVRAFGEPDDPTQGFADSLAAGALAAGADAPLLLTDRQVASAELLAWLDRTPSVEQVVVVGGTAAVDEPVADALRDRGLAVVRAGGAERTETAARVRALGIELLAGDDSPPPPGAPLVLVDRDDPLAWADGFTAALVADPTRGGGVLLAGEGGASAQPQATVMALLDAPTPSPLSCAPLLRAGACPSGEAIRLSAEQDPTLVARAVEGEVILDATVRTEGAVCIDVRVEGAVLDSVEVTGSGLAMPPPIEGRSTICDIQVFPGTVDPPAGERVRAVLDDGRVIEAVLAEA